MDAFQVFSIIGITSTAILGLFNLFINLNNQRKHHRELIFQKQLDFFMRLQIQLNSLQNSISDMNQTYTELSETQDSIYNLTNTIDDDIENNELILPDSLYDELHEFVLYCSKICNLAQQSPSSINKELKGEFIDRNVDLLMSIREFFGIEKLSEENLKLLKMKMTEIKLNRQS